MGSYLSQPVKTKESEGNENSRFSYASVSMQGWRTNMEDAHINNLDIDNKGTALFGVFDGHGGFEVAQYVAKKFQNELINSNEYQSGKYKEALERTFLRMDELIKSQDGTKEIDNQNAGCTANVVLITNDKIYCANCGDSRAIVSVKGTAVALSEDHKPDDDKEKKRIQNAGGEVFQGRVNGNLNLSRALGDLEYKVNEKDPKNTDPKDFIITAFPDVTDRQLNADIELIILGCDGIWECRSNQAIVDTFKNKSVQLKEQCEKFLDDILAPTTAGQTSGLDNMSIIVIRVKH
ncbi:hypothetical protein ABPG72_013639 [Tetrahymena utriculariae]